jgi:hypothetical protein
LILIRIILALFAVPITVVWVMLSPGGRPSGTPVPLGIISYLMAIALPSLAVGQIIHPNLLKPYLFLLLGPILLWWMGATVSTLGVGLR